MYSERVRVDSLSRAEQRCSAFCGLGACMLAATSCCANVNDVHQSKQMATKHIKRRCASEDHERRPTNGRFSAWCWSSGAGFEDVWVGTLLLLCAVFSAVDNCSFCVMIGLKRSLFWVEHLKPLELFFWCEHLVARAHFLFCVMFP